MLRWVLSNSRSGTTVVEFAMIAPVLFSLMFGCIEVARAVMVIHVLEEAARVGCRQAILDEAQELDVENVVAKLMAAAGITVASSDIEITPDPLTAASLWEAVTVKVSVPYKEFCWLPVPRFMGAITLSGASTLPREGNSQSELNT